MAYSDWPWAGACVLQGQLVHVYLKIHVRLQPGLLQRLETEPYDRPVEIGSKRSKAFHPLSNRRKSSLLVDDLLRSCDALMVPARYAASKFVDKILEVGVRDCAVQPCPSRLVRGLFRISTHKSGEYRVGVCSHP